MTIRRSEQVRVDRDVLAITIVLWSAHFALLATRSVFAGKVLDVPSTAARLFTSIAAAILAYSISRILRRLETDGALHRFGWACLLSVPAALLVSTVSELLFLAAQPAYRAKHGGWFSIDSVELAGNFSFFFWVFVAWSALYANAVAAAGIRERDRRLSDAETAATRAQLLALRLQLHPHFLFNTLNTLSGLIALNRKKQAEDLILNLSSFLRLTLTGSPAQLIPLQRELEAQKVYLTIEQTRYGERLIATIDMPDGLADVLVPSLILQPLIENAVKHAVTPEGTVHVEIKAIEDEGFLKVAVENSSSGGAEHATREGFGIGLSNVRQRLAALYGTAARLDAGWSSPGVWTSVVVIPISRGEH